MVSGERKRTGRYPGEFDVTHAYEIFSCLGRYWGDFNSCPDSETMGRVAKRWEEKYGLKLVELSHDTLTFQSDRRISKKEAVEITEETVELCAEIVNGKKISRSRQSAEQGGLHYGGISA